MARKQQTKSKKLKLKQVVNRAAKDEFRQFMKANDKRPAKP